ncbi:Hsp33 family molecular chaperone HslO [Acholeplasma equirhinis]|uniref:Hsp33 family molecular chaperone HslO n=1 Tax=Acholeplasma equirhinis TaxID=555393 RepID=UPI00197A8B7D|nr:Hsp33 family molecular chaperone HslO [Acholeplasma equirhinis]MBN3491008.1 Hsp33 family molecular chaperone HslO [Acholeplasma equirhinis]
MKDYTVIALAYNGEARIYASVSTTLVEKSRKLHQTMPTASAAMGRFITASAMMSLMYKDGERIQLKIAGDGPVGTMLVDAKFGVVKSRIDNPNVYLVYEDGPKKGKLNVGAAVGSGYLYVTKDWKGNYFTSSAELQTGEIGDDFTYYYATSEQTPSAVGLGVLVAKTQKVILSGGFIIQVLPGASNSTISKLESALSKITSVTDYLADGKTPEDMISLLADNTERILETHPIKYYCGCRRSKYKKSLSQLDKKTLTDILIEDKQAEIVCPYCNKKYIFNEEELKEIIAKKA